MGEVYKARDTRLDRTVAVKVLPLDMAAAPELRERFEREARTVASLNHPHICALHDLGRDSGTDFLVLEYLEGETLTGRLERGALPFELAITIATQIADALDKAHRAGVVHRDVKPGNIILTKSGAKLLDFGLAKVQASAFAQAHLSTLPTQPNPRTAQGTVLGTMQYMAPEQIEGQDADARADIFAFGVVLYEMLAGRKPVVGKTPASLFGAIMKEQPPRLSSDNGTPPALDHLIRCCLEKDRDERMHSMHDVLLQLRSIAGETSPSPSRITAAAQLATLMGHRDRVRPPRPYNAPGCAHALAAPTVRTSANALYACPRTEHRFLFRGYPNGLSRWAAGHLCRAGRRSQRAIVVAIARLRRPAASRRHARRSEPVLVP